MQKDEFTVVIFPGAMGSPKKFCLQKKFAKLAFAVTGVLILAFLGSSVYFTKQYLKLQCNEIELARIQKESNIRKIQVEKFSHQVKNFETELARLERFEKKLRVSLHLKILHNL